MIATVSLSTTTLAGGLDPGQRHVTLTSLAGISPGTFLYIDKELLKVLEVTGISTIVLAARGQDGTMSTVHGNGSTVTIGRGDQFYMNDPMGTPPNPIPVYPYINVLTGVSWGVQGDDTGPGAIARSWQPLVTTQTLGAMGVRLNTTTVPS